MIYLISVSFTLQHMFSNGPNESVEKDVCTD